MLDVVVAVNNDTILANNLMRSPLLAQPGVTLQLKKGYSSASLAFGAAMRDCCSDIVIFAHQDAYLPEHWEDRLQHSIAQVEKIDPDWAVLGIYGMKPSGAQIGCVWSSGLDSVFGAPFDEPEFVVSIDEVVIILRRSSGIEFDPALPGYHLYATDIVQTALSHGKGAYVIFAPIVHNSRPSLYLGDDYFAAYHFVANKWNYRLPINNHVAHVVGPGLAYLRIRARHKLNELRHSHVDRHLLDRHYDCVGLARQLGFE